MVSKTNGAGTTSSRRLAVCPTRDTNGMRILRCGSAGRDRATSGVRVDDGPIVAGYHRAHRRAARPARRNPCRRTPARGHGAVGLRDLGRGNLAWVTPRRGAIGETTVQRLAPRSPRSGRGDAGGQLAPIVRESGCHPSPGGLSGCRGCRRCWCGARDGECRGLSHERNRRSALADRSVSSPSGTAEFGLETGICYLYRS